MIEVKLQNGFFTVFVSGREDLGFLSPEQAKKRAEELRKETGLSFDGQVMGFENRTKEVKDEWQLL